MKAQRTIALLCLGTLLVGAGCTTMASEKYVAFATRGQPPDLQVQDRMQCEAIAQQYKGSDADMAMAGGLLGVSTGAALGAATGAISGALNGMAGQGSLAGLAIGGLVGLRVGIAQAVVANQQRKERIYGACMSARGYQVGG